MNVIKQLHAQLKCVLLINVNVTTIVDISSFFSMINVTKARKVFILQHVSLYN